MKRYKIYTAGKMKGLSEGEQLEWRIRIEKAIKRALGVQYSSDTQIVFVHPPVYYTYGQKAYQTEEEVKIWDLQQVRDSDIVIVNLDGVNESVGTHYELGVVDQVNASGNKHIFVIGIGESPETLHPWIKQSMFRIEPDYDKAADYIVEYLLI